MSTESSSVGPQRLAAKSLVECAACHSRVYFRVRSSVSSPDERYKIDYLVCPVCGASATRLREIENLPRPQPIRRAVKYLYKR